MKQLAVENCLYYYGKLNRNINNNIIQKNIFRKFLAMILHKSPLRSISKVKVPSKLFYPVFSAALSHIATSENYLG